MPLNEQVQPAWRPVPKHIDKSDRSAEILLVFAFVFFVVRIPVVLLTAQPTGSETLYLCILGVVLAVLYAKATAAQKPGFLLHLGYRAGFVVKGLLPQSLRRLAR